MVLYFMCTETGVLFKCKVLQSAYATGNVIMMHRVAACAQSKDGIHTRWLYPYFRQNQNMP
jgi:hypothetical protein